MAKLILRQKGKKTGEYALDQDKITIGRGPDNVIQVDDRAVSGNHAAVITILSDSFLEDLGSTNGTYVNGKVVKKHALADGDIITMGGCEFHYQSDQGAGEDEFERTMVISPGRKAAAGIPSMDNVQEAVQQATGDKGAGADGGKKLPAAKLQVLSGANAGQEMQLNKPLTTVGRPGVQVAAITRRGEGYTIVYVPSAGDKGAPSINGKSIGSTAQTLNDNDVIELAGVKMGFFVVE